MELIARRVIARIDPDPEPDLAEYARAGSEKYERLVSEIAKELGLDSLKFSSLETYVKAIGLPKCRICTHCFDGSSYD